ncbi:hypothetical protein NL676_037311 [Syzygium grande]|nr:hypothetical protein NL676_037311 [Syzygium grande]
MYRTVDSTNPHRCIQNRSVQNGSGGEGSVGADTGTVYRQFYREQEVTRALVYRLRKVTGPESPCNAGPRLPPSVEILSWFDSWGARVRVPRGSNVVPVVLLQSGPSTATIVVNGCAPDGLLQERGIRLLALVLPRQVELEKDSQLLPQRMINAVWISLAHPRTSANDRSLLTMCRHPAPSRPMIDAHFLRERASWSVKVKLDRKLGPARPILPMRGVLYR